MLHPMTVATAVGPHLFWITSRAAGILALVLASVGVGLGLIMSLKLARRRGPDLLALHEILSLGTLVAIAIHGLTLLGDSYLRASLLDIAVPFASSYRTLWTSLGIIAGWGLAALGLSYYLRRYIGSARWRRLHRLTALLWLFGLAHSLGEGTDAGQVWFLAMAAVVVVPAALLLVMRLVGEPKPANARHAPARVAATRANSGRVAPPSRPRPPHDLHSIGAPRRGTTGPAGDGRRTRRIPPRPAPSGFRRS